MSNPLDQNRLDGGIYFSDPIHIGDEPEPLENGSGANYSHSSRPSTLDSIQSPSLANRGRRRPGTMPPGEKTLRNIFLDEMHNIHIANENEYQNQQKQLSQKIEQEISSFNNSAGIINTGEALEKASQEQKFLHQRANDAKNQYSANTKVALAFYRESPLYLSRELPFRKLTELIQDKSLNTPEQIGSAWADWDKTSKAAQEQKLAAQRLELFSSHFDSAAKSVDTLSASLADKSTITSKMEAIDAELALHKWIMPDFLSAQIDQSSNSGELTDQLHALKQAAQTLAYTYTSKIGSYNNRNPNINSPLLKPELEALKSLVDAQSSNKLGQAWADYHRALLHSESANHLEKFSQAIEKLEHRAAALSQASQQLMAAEAAAIAQAERARAIAAHQQALETLPHSYASLKAELDKKYGDAVISLPTALAAETQSTSGLGELTGQPPLEAILRKKTQINYLTSKKLELSKSKDTSARLFAGIDPLEITSEQYKAILGARSTSAEQAYQIHQEWTQAYKDALDARLQKRATEQLMQSSSELSESYAEHVFLTQQKNNELLIAKHISDAGRLWSAVASPNAPTQTRPDAWERASEVAKKMLLRKAAAALGKQLPIIAAFYPADMASGERPSEIFSTPAAELGVADVDLGFIADRKGTIDVTHRLAPDSHTQDGRLKWVEADGVNYGNKVRVRPVTYDSATNTYIFTRDGETVPTLIWTPQVSPENSSTHLPTATQHSPAYAGAKPDNVLPETFTSPEHVREPDDYILKLPAELGGSQYVYFKGPRDIPGIASGTGQFISGTWLSEKTRNEGAPIPSQIADQLRGRKFSNFDKMREALWEAVSNDPKLNSQLSISNKKQVSRGRAPYPRKSDQQGGRDKFEIHHIHEVSKGGAVYDVDNMVILTPVQHIQYHKEN